MIQTAKYSEDMPTICKNQLIVLKKQGFLF